MSSALQYVIYFINASFIALFLVHISLIGYFIINPEVPETIIYKKNIKEIKFPIIFRICLFEIDDQSLKYQNVGYSDVSGFFRGQSMYNESWVGWMGHTINKTVIGTVDGT